MNLQPEKSGILQHFLKQRPDILKMCQKSSGVFITFPAVSLVSIKAETVVETSGLIHRLFDKLVTKISEYFLTALIYPEIGNDGAACVLCSHDFPLCRKDFDAEIFLSNISYYRFQITKKSRPSRIEAKRVFYGVNTP